MGEKVIFHIDANSAFLSWEAVYRLQQGSTVDLREIPSIVGGDPKTRRGIVLAKSIPAKKYKIQTGETLHKALSKCPTLTIVSPSYGLYVKCSREMVNIIKEFSPVVDRFSIDECFLDYSNVYKLWGDPVETAYVIKDRIKKELGFTVNIGISSNKLLAKVASDFTKPDRVHTLFPHELEEKLWPLPVEDLYMVGRATKPKLNRMGIYTIGELANADRDLIQYRLKKHGALIWDYAHGIDTAGFLNGTESQVKGIGNSTTIAFDVTDRATAHMYLLSLTEMVAMRLRDKGFTCRLVSVSIRNHELNRYSHQRKLFFSTDATMTIYEAVKALFDEAWELEPIRHLGVRVSDFTSNTHTQKTFFDPEDVEKQKKLDTAIDDIRLKYGNRAIMRGTFSHTGVKPMSGGVHEKDYPIMRSVL